MRFLLLLWLTATVALGAPGAVQTVTILADGKTADVTFEGMAVAGTYDFGLGANGDPTTGTPKVVFTVVSLGYSDAGTATTNTRTVWGTVAQRRAYPNEAQHEESSALGAATVRIVLSDYIYSKDNTGSGNSGTAPTVSILAGLYDDGALANTASGGGFAVTNNSTATHQDAIGAWAWPGYQLMDSTTQLRAVVFHRHGQSGRPVRAVKFTVTDGTTTNTEIVTAPTYDSTVGDAAPVVEYVTTTDLTAGLTQGATLTSNFYAYPWVGDSDSVLDSSTGSADPTPFVGPKTGICNRLGTYGVTMALVNPSTGVDATGVAYDSASYNAATAAPFASLAQAARACYAYNLANRSRGDVGGAIVEMADGTHTWLGTPLTAGYGTTPGTWITFRKAPTATRSGVILSAAAGNSDVTDRVKLEDITVANTTTAFANCLAMWLHNCDLTSTAAALWNTAGQRVWITGGSVGPFTQKLRHFGTTDMNFPLIRGVDMSLYTGETIVYTVIGNKRVNTTTGGPSFVDRASGTITNPPTTPILAFNELYGYDVSSGLAIIKFGWTENANSLGAVIAQNLIEVRAGAAGGPGNIASAEGVTGNAPFNNVIFWHNTFVGQRTQFAYNSSGTVSKDRAYWSVKLNYWDVSGFKTDTFTGSGGGSANRIGNWPVGFGVGATDNVNGNVSTIATPEFNFDFFGLNSIDTEAANAHTYPMFVDRKSYNGSNGVGVGNYRVTAGSPLEGDKLSWVLPFDLAGDARDADNTATGVYVFGTATGTNTDPVVTITSPTTGASTTSPATLVGTATDAEDGDLSASLVWTSSIDGPLGTGASISAPLTVGSHTITATVTDTGALDDDASITLTITAPSASGTINANRVNATSVRIQ